MLLTMKYLLIILFFFLFSCGSTKNKPTIEIKPFFDTWTPPGVKFQNQDKRWAYCLSVYDGDTVTLWIENGFNVFQLWKCRLYGIDAPEVTGSEKPMGLITKAWLSDEILNKYILIDVYGGKTDKYGRLLVTIYKNDDYFFTTPLNVKMIELGLVKEYLLKEIRE